MNEFTEDAIAARREAQSLYMPQDADALAKYLKGRGRPVFCRLEFKLTSLEELKKAAVIVSDLNQQLQALAYESEAEPLLRVLVARDFIHSARLDLKVWSASRDDKLAEMKAAAAQHKRAKSLKKPATNA